MAIVLVGFAIACAVSISPRDLHAQTSILAKAEVEEESVSINKISGYTLSMKSTMEIEIDYTNDEGATVTAYKAPGAYYAECYVDAAAGPGSAVLAYSSEYRDIYTIDVTGTQTIWMPPWPPFELPITTTVSIIDNKVNDTYDTISMSACFDYLTTYGALIDVTP